MSNLRQITPNRLAKTVSNVPVIEKTLKIHQNVKKRRRSVVWGALNIFLLIMLVYDVTHTCVFYVGYFQYFEYVLSAIFALNLCYHCFHYLRAFDECESIPVSSEQKTQLGVKDLDPNYSIVNRSQFDNSPSSPSFNIINWKSNTPTLFNSTPQSNSRPHSTPKNMSFEWNKSGQSPNSSGSKLICDEDSLVNYLKEYETYEKSINLSTSVEHTGNVLSSFWNYSGNKGNSGSPMMFKKSQYQLSSDRIGTSNSPDEADLNTSSFSGSPQSIEVWRKFNVNPMTLTQWTANIRMWISQTILERLVKEFEFIDSALQKHGIVDVTIGTVSIDRLRKTAQSASVVQYIPTLSLIVPFLEVTSNQEYLVQRIRELAQGGCMSDFRWNGGSKLNGKDWTDSLPTDSDIVMHFFATYMDTQLFPKPNKPDEKPFSGYHYIKPSYLPPVLTPQTLAVHQYNEKPPYFRCIVGEEIIAIPRGYNNLFHTLLMFLYQVRKREAGMLGQVNLGRSGVNILWVIDG